MTSSTRLEAFEDFQRGGVRCGSARAVVDLCFGFENLDRDVLARQSERSDDPDRSGSGDDNGAFGGHSPGVLRQAHGSGNTRNAAYATRVVGARTCTPASGSVSHMTRLRPLRLAA